MFLRVIRQFSFLSEIIFCYGIKNYYKLKYFLDKFEHNSLIFTTTLVFIKENLMTHLLNFNEFKKVTKFKK